MTSETYILCMSMTPSFATVKNVGYSDAYFMVQAFFEYLEDHAMNNVIVTIAESFLRILVRF